MRQGQTSVRALRHDKKPFLQAAVTSSWIRWPLALATTSAVVSAGCNAQAPAQAASASAPRTAEASQHFHSYNLTLYGYNYSDTGISSFEVNGHGGANLNVSTPTAGGGGSVCCVRVSSPMIEPQTVAIKWSRDAETWCEQSVQLKPPLPAKPEYFEVHFYEDGHIEVAVTEAISPPRIQLQRDGPGSRHANEALNINNDSKLARCKRGYR